VTNIPAERAALSAQGLDMRTREQWGAVFDYTTDRDCDVPASRLFLHLAVVNPTTMDATQQAIERIGISRFPNTGYSYNAAVWTDGTLLEGQPLTRRGAHTVNDFQRSPCPHHGGPVNAPGWNLNINSRAMVLPQNVQHPVTDAQVDSAARWAAAQKRAGYVTRDAIWHGHRCVAAKSCPGDKGWARIHEIVAWTEHYTVHGLSPEPQEDDVTPAELDERFAYWLPRFGDVLRKGTPNGAFPPGSTVAVDNVGLDGVIAAHAVDVPALAAALAVELAPLLPDPTELTQQQIQEACEAATRQVLGGLDTPPA